MALPLDKHTGGYRRAKYAQPDTRAFVNHSSEPIPQERHRSLQKQYFRVKSFMGCNRIKFIEMKKFIGLYSEKTLPTEESIGLYSKNFCGLLGNYWVILENFVVCGKLSGYIRKKLYRWAVTNVSCQFLCIPVIPEKNFVTRGFEYVGMWHW